MLALGRTDMLESELELTELVVPFEDGWPVIMPDVGDGDVVVFGVSFADGMEKLSVCNSLQEMRNEQAWCLNLSCMTGATGFSWYVADFAQCMLVYDNLMTMASGVV